MGIYVAPDPAQISPSGEDLRPPGRTTLRIVITTALVSGVRTLAYGDRVDPAKRVNHPAHRRIIEHSPLKPFVEVEGDGKARRKRRDLLRRDHLDDYLFRLNRHAGRRVDAAVSAGDETGMVTLDYLVTERSPLVL